MSKALVLMKAMPPTHGHKNLIEFASHVATEGHVLVDTADDEPMVVERLTALIEMMPHGWVVDHVEFNESDPNDPYFWEVWDAFLEPYKGFDFVVASEDYAFKVAEKIGARYIPYDPSREMRDVRATSIRRDPFDNFKLMAPTFQPFMRTVVTIWGAESTGKSTLTRRLHEIIPSHTTFEYARPYLETVGPEITKIAMEEIWFGQWALEAQSLNWKNKPVLIRDTDLYSTIGYWAQEHWAAHLGNVPLGLIADADRHKSDLYIIPKSNIPFEEDPIRYGGDKRESPDQYWIDLAEKYNLNYVVLENSDLNKRVDEAYNLIMEVAENKLNRIKYERPNNG